MLGLRHHHWCPASVAAPPPQAFFWGPLLTASERGLSSGRALHVQAGTWRNPPGNTRKNTSASNTTMDSIVTWTPLTLHRREPAPNKPPPAKTHSSLHLSKGNTKFTLRSPGPFLSCGHREGGTPRGAPATLRSSFAT